MHIYYTDFSHLCSVRVDFVFGCSPFHVYLYMQYVDILFHV